LSSFISNFVKQINQAILLRDIKKQEKLLIQALKSNPHEDTALDCDDDITPIGPAPLAPTIHTETPVHSQPQGCESR